MKPLTSANADPNEINQFNAIAEDWWNLEGSFKPLHEINPLRLEFITQVLDLQDLKLADVGCGGGIFAEALAKNGAQVTGIDASEKAIETAIEHAAAAQLKIDYRCELAEDLSASSANQFDVVTCMELLEHVPSPQSVIQACSDLVKPGGDVFFSTINRNLKSYAFAIIGAEYLLKLLPQGMHNYAKFIKPSELAAWSRQSGLDVMRIIGITYRPLQKTYQLSSNTDVNYIIHCRKSFI